MLSYVDREPYRRDIKRMRNLQEGRHGLAKHLFHGRKGELLTPTENWIWPTFRDETDPARATGPRSVVMPRGCGVSCGDEVLVDLTVG